MKTEKAPAPSPEADEGMDCRPGPSAYPPASAAAIIPEELKAVLGRGKKAA